MPPRPTVEQRLNQRMQELLFQLFSNGNQHVLTRASGEFCLIPRRRVEHSTPHHLERGGGARA
jgi:hypothetical protein